MTKPEDIISDQKCIEVHAHANFGDRSPRWVVNDGVLKFSMGYHCGYTQLQILHEHKLIMKPKKLYAIVNKVWQNTCGHFVVQM